MNIIIIGSGGHALVVADILRAMDNVIPLGYVSLDDPCEDGPLGLPILGDDTVLPDISHDGMVIAIGDNTQREATAKRLSDNETFVSAIHPSAIIAPDTVIEPGCMICAGVVVNPGAVIRSNTILNTGCTVDHDCEIGPHAHIAPGVNLAGNVSVGKGAFVGIGASVIQGIVIGEGATVGAGAAVIKDVAPDTTVVGVPARQTG